jgi:broad-specificity NMP kinase
MGRRNYLVEGVSGTGKTSVCDELERRGYHAIHGDRELAYQGDPATGAAVEGHTHEHHIWHVEKVEAVVADQDAAETFFCGGSRNLPRFIGLFDAVFVLTVDLDTLNRRLDERTSDDDERHPSHAEREIIERLHTTSEDTPEGIPIDATAPVERVVDTILEAIARSTRASRRLGSSCGSPNRAGEGR